MLIILCMNALAFVLLAIEKGTNIPSVLFRILT